MDIELPVLSSKSRKEIQKERNLSALLVGNWKGYEGPPMEGPPFSEEERDSGLMTCVIHDEGRSTKGCCFL